MGEAGCYLHQLRRKILVIMTECSITDFLSFFHFLKVYGFTLIHIYYYPICFIPRDYKNKIRFKKRYYLWKKRC